jgi:molybdenum cofactor cytidylyltransferase
MNNTGIIILAAGSSSRFGSAKQLLTFNHKTLLQHAIDEAVKAGAEPVVVVTGANEDKVYNDINQGQAKIVSNKNWQQGMASSIVAGLQAAISCNSEIENIIIAVCDQPFISFSLFEKLHQKQQESDMHIVACAYAGTIGTPALFTQKYFDALLTLEGDEGAKKILLANKGDLAVIDFPHGNIDIDTQQDYEDLLHKKQHIL